MTTGKTIALTRWIFVGKVMSLLLNILSRLVITFLPRSKCLNFMAAITICSDSGAPKNKVCHCFHCFPIYLPWSDGTGCHDLSFLNVELSMYTKYLKPCSTHSRHLRMLSKMCMHAKLHQLCPTLCDPMDRSLPGSSVHGILQARILG